MPLYRVHTCWLAIVSTMGFSATATAQQDPQAPLTISPASSVVCGDRPVTFLARQGDRAVEVQWTLDPAGRAAGTLQPPALEGSRPPTPGSSGAAITFVPPPPNVGSDASNRTGQTGFITLTATAPAGTGGRPSVATARIELQAQCGALSGGTLARTTLGFEQVGAAGAASEQKFLFDFFISRPLSLRSGRAAATADNHYFGPRLRWWGNVRAGSYPQQVNSDIATFSQEFAKTAGAIKVNQLVNTAEFMTGLEVRLSSATEPRDSLTDGARERYMLTAFGGIGAVGPFPPPDDAVVFELPTDKSSAQYQAVKTVYPELLPAGENAPVPGKYVAFVPRPRSQFTRRWAIGARLYSFETARDASSTPLTRVPASVDVSFGRDYLVAPSGGAVWRASAFYPFALGDRADSTTPLIYLFGDVSMRLRRDAAVGAQAPLYLAPAKDAQGAAIPLTNKDVILKVRDNERDTYRIGVAVDLLRIWNRLKASSNSGTAAAGSGNVN